MSSDDIYQGEMLAHEIAAAIQDEEAGDFNALLLRLFARQYARNAAYRVFCDSLDRSPANALTWKDVPAVPARAFKIADLTCAPDNTALVFHSSGTTEGQTSRHLLDKTAVALYTLSLRTGFYKIVPRALPILALMPPPQDAPHSSLSFMLGALDAESFYWGESNALEERLNHAVAQNAPVCIFATAFALLDLFDGSAQCWKLPAGSYVIETGGFKGRTRQVERRELYALIADRLGVRPPRALAEYGMSEMASQFYGTPEEGLTSPHWLRARIIDPITGEDADEGLLCHYDLANWNSVAAIQTQDRARRLPNGRFELLGRAAGAELRGCSLSVEERWIQTRR